ncbi:hypothetical protein OIU34_16880 [Pararhizobium sp. BT-229]|uniref:hypothetical protein n=1 Tax=Pararhizobium sp. BT-229 TaxID=2986923 RepID=UPI0021F6EA60|nr:hypothetical protein [Pararhizobium sp. BT-229]MCV9963580.1 hypothetical protein [Pararhizobium sp. BT-229]
MKFGTTTQPTAQSTNLVDLMDGYFRLYAPIVSKLLEDYPEAHGVHTFIGRDDPTAIPTNEQGQGYGLKSFEKRASKELGKLVQQTMNSRRAARLRKASTNPSASTHIGWATKSPFRSWSATGWAASMRSV